MIRTETLAAPSLQHPAEAGLFRRMVNRLQALANPSPLSDIGLPENHPARRSGQRNLPLSSDAATNLYITSCRGAKRW